MEKKIKSKKDTCEPEDLEGYIMVEASIECEVCSKGTMSMNDYNAAEEFYNEGWRVFGNEDEGKLYCPKCAKKYLKNK